MFAMWTNILCNWDKYIWTKNWKRETNIKASLPIFHPSPFLFFILDKFIFYILQIFLQFVQICFAIDKLGKNRQMSKHPCQDFIPVPQAATFQLSQDPCPNLETKIMKTPFEIACPVMWQTLDQQGRYQKITGYF